MDAKIIANFDPKTLTRRSKGSGYPEEMKALEEGNGLVYNYNVNRMVSALRHYYDGIHCVRQLNDAKDGYVWVVYLEKGWKHREDR